MDATDQATIKQFLAGNAEQVPCGRRGKQRGAIGAMAGDQLAAVLGENIQLARFTSQFVAVERQKVLQAGGCEQRIGQTAKRQDRRAHGKQRLRHASDGRCRVQTDQHGQDGGKANQDNRQLHRRLTAPQDRFEWQNAEQQRHRRGQTTGRSDHRRQDSGQAEQGDALAQIKLAGQRHQTGQGQGRSQQGEDNQIQAGRPLFDGQHHGNEGQADHADNQVEQDETRMFSNLIAAHWHRGMDPRGRHVAQRLLR